MIDPFHLSYVQSLETKLVDQTNELENRHLDAAIDAQISHCPSTSSSSSLGGTKQTNNSSRKKQVIFDDYVNPDAVPNCLSPFVPATSEQIGWFLFYLKQRSHRRRRCLRRRPRQQQRQQGWQTHEDTRVKQEETGNNVDNDQVARIAGDGDEMNENSNERDGQDDIVMLDLGSGDGRVCVSAAKLGLVAHAVGLDVSPICVRASKLLAFQEGVFGIPSSRSLSLLGREVGIASCNPTAKIGAAAAEEESNTAMGQQCEFYQIDLTVPPYLLLDNPHLLSEKIKSANVIFLYTYPTLLKRLIPLLSRLTDRNRNATKDDYDAELIQEGEKKMRAEVVTLVYHIPKEFTRPGHVWDVDGTDLRIYDRIVTGTTKEHESAGNSDVVVPEPVDGDQIDKQLARDSITLTLPR